MSMDCRSHVQTHNHPSMLCRNISTYQHITPRSFDPPSQRARSSRVITVASPCASLPRVVLRPQWLTHRPPACPIPCRRENPSLVPTECRCPPDSRHSTRQEHHLTQNVGTEEFLQQKTTTIYHKCHPDELSLGHLGDTIGINRYKFKASPADSYIVLPRPPLKEEF